jgi:hypothetical protein
MVVDDRAMNEGGSVAGRMFDSHARTSCPNCMPSGCSGERGRPRPEPRVRKSAE